MAETTETTPLAPSLPRARSFPWLAYTLVSVLGLTALLAGIYLLYRGEPQDGTVNQVRITAKSDIDLGKVEDMLDTPDYYIELWTAQGKQSSEVFKDTRVGGGLTFTLPVPLGLRDVKEVRLYDQDVMKDKLVDRIDQPVRVINGERFRFELLGADPPQPLRVVAYSLVAAGGAVLLIAIIRFIWFQVI